GELGDRTTVDVLAPRDDLEHGAAAVGQLGEAPADVLPHGLVLGPGLHAPVRLAPGDVEPHTGAARLHRVAPGLRAAPVHEYVLEGVVALAQTARQPLQDAAPQLPAAVHVDKAPVGEPAVHVHEAVGGARKAVVRDDEGDGVRARFAHEGPDRAVEVAIDGAGGGG